MINITLTVTPEVAKQIIDMVSAVPAAPQQGIAPNPAFEAALPPAVQQTALPAQAPVPEQAPAQQQPVTQTTESPASLPTTEQAYTQEQLALAATQILDAGRQAELIQLLGSFGVQALTQLPQQHYGAFATSLRGLGARI